MNIANSSTLGIVFLGLSFAAVFTMFRFWGYPYDEITKKSSCPQWKMNIHRAIGYAYVIVYVLMMAEMIPRLWEYQVEFPPRTVVHILLGTTIGVILIVKISIIRFFRHFEEWMPALGVSLLLCSVLLGTMSLPAVFKERALAENAFSEENRARVARLLPEAGLPEDVDLSTLVTVDALKKGRNVLLDKCVACHDLKTVISKPRTPSDWVRTCKRMVDKPSLGGVITLEEGELAAAYLIAITPDLQRSAKLKRADEIDHGASKQAANEVLGDVWLAPGGADAGVAPPQPDPTKPDSTKPDPKKPDPKKPDPKKPDPKKPDPKKPDPKKPDPKQPDPKKPDPKQPDAGVPDPAKPEKPVEPTPPKPALDFKKAKGLYNEECSLCHSTKDVDDAPPTTRKEVNQLLSRMIDNGLDLEKEDLALIRFYLIRTYVK